MTLYRPIVACRSCMALLRNIFVQDKPYNLPTFFVHDIRSVFIIMTQSGGTSVLCNKKDHVISFLLVSCSFVLFVEVLSKGFIVVTFFV